MQSILRFCAAVAVLAAALLLGPAGPTEAQAPTGTVIIQVAEPGGAYASGFCLQPGQLVAQSFTCSDGSPQYVDFVNGGGSATRTLAPGTYNAAVGSLSPFAIGAVGPVTVAAGETITCTFTMAAAPSCTDSPDPSTATVLITIDEPSGQFATGFCLQPGQTVLGSTVCSDGSSATSTSSPPASPSPAPWPSARTTPALPDSPR
jgi:hypothetical protein